MSTRSKYSGPVAGRDVRNPNLKNNPGVFQAAAIQAEFARSLGSPSIRPMRGKGKGKRRGKLPPGVSAATLAQIEKTKKDPHYRSHNHTLAQRLGLKERPPDKLTPEEWDDVHARYQERTQGHHHHQPQQQQQQHGAPGKPPSGKATPSRTQGRQGRAEPEADRCPICRDGFTDEDQVLLSCSHSFHASCIASFEKYVKVRACPVCRTAQYRKKFIRDGHEHHIKKSAREIQRLWRGHWARRAVFTGIDTPPSTSTLRQRYYAFKMQGVSDKYMAIAQEGADDIDSLFAELDASLAHSRAIMGHEIPRPATAITSREWQLVAEQARSRAQSKCPICMSQYHKHEHRALLSCGHVFHSQCISAFEEYDLEYKRQCPMCREQYVRVGMSAAGDALTKDS